MAFLNPNKPSKTVMIQHNDLDFIYSIIEKAKKEGADAFGLQTESLLPEQRNEETYRALFAAMERPVYVTHYRKRDNEGKSYEELAEHLKLIAKCGGTLIDVMGDFYCPHPEELTDDPEAVEKQKKLIAELHALGAEVLMSSHVLKYTPAERVLEIALAQQERGADIVKIVTGAESPEQEIENLRIVTLLKEKLKVPFLYLSGGECKILRRLGPHFGCCMWLCVAEHTEFSTKAQPLLSELNQIEQLI